MSSSEYQLRKCADLRTISQEWTVCILEFFDTSQVKSKPKVMIMKQIKKNKVKNHAKLLSMDLGQHFLRGHLPTFF